MACAREEGRPAPEVVEAAPALRAFNVLNNAAVMSRAADGYDQPTLDRLRMRLQGGFDLHAF